MRALPGDYQGWRLEERRKEARYSLILRAGVLEQDGRSSLCIVKNISSTGIQIRFYTPPIRGAEAFVRVADEPAVMGRIVWIRGDHAGLSFEGRLDTVTLLRVRQKPRPNRRRSIPRVSVKASASLLVGGRTYRAEVSDISSLGARIRTNIALTPGDPVVLALADLPPINAFVRWNHGRETGVTFETPIPTPVIARWIEGRAIPDACKTHIARTCPTTSRGLQERISIPAK